MKGSSGFSKQPMGRPPVLQVGTMHAEKVRKELRYVHPTELSIEALAHLRGVLVRSTPSSGARASLVRLGERGIIGVTEGLSDGARRWAIAHELGHFEAHPHVSYLGLCTGEDLRADYRSSGREPEANAFAAELLLPKDLLLPLCDVKEVRWEPVESIAKAFLVSLTAAAFRFVQLTDERAIVVCCEHGAVKWSAGNRSFGPRPPRGMKLDGWSLAYDFFAKNDERRRRETVSASAWVPGLSDDLELVEHVIPMPMLGQTLSLLWFRP